jgi:hypothetical protein
MPEERPSPSRGDTAPADQAAAPAAAPHGAGRPLHSHCQNCGTLLAGPYCHRCGQHDFDFHRSFGHVTLEALESLFHFDAKFCRNIVTLLFRPGRLTAEFNAGKRAAQMPPFRLYLFVSVLFFFLFFFGHRTPEQFVYDAPGKAKPARAATDQVSEPHRKAEDPALPRAPGTPEDARTLERPQQTGASRWLEDHLKMALEPEHQKEALRELRHNLPHLLMFCLPWFALYTRVLFRRSGWVYLQHLVLAIHFHTFICLWLMVRDGWVGLVGLFLPGLGGSLSSLCDLWLTLYPVVMLRNLFGNSWLRTTLKSGVLATAYLATLFGALAAMALLLFFLM